MQLTADWLWSKVWSLWEKKILRNGYRPAKYWGKRGLGFHFEDYQGKIGDQHTWMLKKLRGAEWETLLEVGCGFGRNLRFISEHFPTKKLEGLEFSWPMRKQADIYLKNKTVIHDFSITDPHLNLKFTEKYDVVLSHGVLMHIPFAEIDQALANISALIGKYFILVEQTKSNGMDSLAWEINKFTFSHPYADFLGNHGLKIVDLDSRNGLLAIFCEKVKSEPEA